MSQRGAYRQVTESGGPRQSRVWQQLHDAAERSTATNVEK